MKYIYRVEATLLEKVNHEEENLPGWIPEWKVVTSDPCNRLFLNKEDAKGYCNLMNEMFKTPNKDSKRMLYHYWKETICESKYKKYAK